MKGCGKVTCSPVNSKERASIFHQFITYLPVGHRPSLGKHGPRGPRGLACSRLCGGQSPSCCSQECFISKEEALSPAPPGIHHVMSRVNIPRGTSKESCPRAGRPEGHILAPLSLHQAPHVAEGNPVQWQMPSVLGAEPPWDQV